jgi:chromosome partitioning protein
VLDNIAQAYDVDIVEPAIPRSIRFAEAPAAGRSILRTAGSTRGALAYRALANNLSRTS